jgi:hypothetical protein
MTAIEKLHSEKLVELARSRFDFDLAEPELRVLRDSVSQNYPPRSGQESGQENQTIPTEFLRWLATDADAAPLIDPKGIRIVRVNITGDLDLSACSIKSPLAFIDCTIGGKVNLQFAETRNLLIFNSSVDGGILGDMATIDGTLYIHKSILSGPVRLINARIRSNLRFEETQLLVPNEYAVSADVAEIGGGIFFSGGFQSTGTIRLPNARIKGNLDCAGAKLLVASGDALAAPCAEIGGNVFLNRNFETTGRVLLSSAKIAGGLFCDDATLLVKSGHALDASGARIGGDAFFKQNFISTGSIGVGSAQIEGKLMFLGATVVGADCTNMTVAGDFIWIGVRPPNLAALSLANAKIKGIHDDHGSWPESGRLRLNGLTYQELTIHKSVSGETEFQHFAFAGGSPARASERIDWLMLQSPKRRLSPQPWIQLSTHLESLGDRRGARHVLYKFHCLQAAEEEHWPLARWWLIVFAWLEEAPARIAYSIAFTLLLGWLIFAYANSKGAMAPTDAKAYDSFVSGAPMPSAYPALNPFVYTLENALPLTKLGQDEKWSPDRRHISATPFTNYWFLMWSRWSLILSGWFQATVLAAALSRRFKS